MKRCLPGSSRFLPHSRSLLLQLLLCLGLLLCCLPQSSVFAWPTVYPTGTTLYDPQTAFNGYTLFAPVAPSLPHLPNAAPPKAMPGQPPANLLYLIDMRGDVVHKWSLPFTPLQARLQPSGNVLVVGQNDTVKAGRPGLVPYWIGGAAGWLAEFTWDGKKVFEHEDLAMHHDFARLPNGHIIYLAWEPVPPVLQARIRGGMKGSEFKGGVMFNDYLVEIDGQGKEVWRWSANAHLDPDIDVMGPLYKREEWLHGNSLALLPNGNIVLSSRNTDALLVIERKSGKIISRWGNTAYWDKANKSIEYRFGSTTLGGPHGASVVPPDAPGAGHVLCYDNGLYTDGSRWVEVDLARNEHSEESAPPLFGRRQFSFIMGNAQRLPNGNTFVCEGSNGRFAQMAASGGAKVVWEYVNPFIPAPGLQGAVFQAHVYAPGYCPQFKRLPTAFAAITPPDAAQFRVPVPGAPSSNPSDSGVMPMETDEAKGFPPALIAIAFLCAIFAAFLVGRKLPAK